MIRETGNKAKFEFSLDGETWVPCEGHLIEPSLGAGVFGDLLAPVREIKASVTFDLSAPDMLRLYNFVSWLSKEQTYRLN